MTFATGISRNAHKNISSRNLFAAPFVFETNEENPTTRTKQKKKDRKRRKNQLTNLDHRKKTTN